MTPAESLFHQASAHLDARDFAAARDVLRAAFALDPDSAAVEANLAYALDACGEGAAAETHYRHAIARDPHALQIRLNLGALLTAQRRLDAALDVYAAALDVAPAAPALLSNLGMTLACAGREVEAEARYRAALALDPGHRKAAFNLAYLLLRQGRWEEGFMRLEQREWVAALQRHLDVPRWQGEPLDGKRILVGIEAGHGDMIQFCRYCSALKDAGAAHVTLLCHPALAPLLAGVAGVDAVLGLDAPLPRSGWDAWTPPLSLPYRFGTTVDQVPAALPYVRPDPARVARLAPWLAGGDALDAEDAVDAVGAFKVGLVWRGNPRFENDGERSLPALDVLAPLGAVPGVRFFSLQKGVGADAARRGVAGLALTDLAPALGDFADTAALIAGLDLVITVDTAVAHLSGALGKRCWVLLPAYLTDWRWLKERSDTPWYPGVMRLFRQRASGTWDDVVADVSVALREAVRAAGAGGGR